MIVKFKTFRANFFYEKLFCAASLAGQTIRRNINFKIFTVLLITLTENRAGGEYGLLGKHDYCSKF